MSTPVAWDAMCECGDPSRKHVNATRAMEGTLIATDSRACIQIDDLDGDGADFICCPCKCFTPLSVDNQLVG